MRKVYYIYNTKTRTYDRVYPTFWQRLLTIIRRFLWTVVLGGLAFLIFYLLIQTPSINDLRVENARLLSQYNIISQRLDEAADVLHDIQLRDDNLYRVIVGSDPISSEARNAGYGGTNRYESLADMNNSELVINTTQKMDMLSKQLYIQSKSFDEVVALCKEHEEQLQSIPAIQPISNNDLKRTSSGFGWRIDPIYKTRKMHAGMDFACDTGTPVYATGNGVIVTAKWVTTYGYLVEIDHGYGYHTRYAHLSKLKVKVGQKVVRGEEIALSGNTGKSIGPHVHYEVIVKGIKVNPVNYYFMDLDADEYEQMVEMAENHGKVFD